MKFVVRDSECDDSTDGEWNSLNTHQRRLRICLHSVTVTAAACTIDQTLKEQFQTVLPLAKRAVPVARSHYN